MESGSRTVGNSLTRSSGLFHPSTSPLHHGHSQQPDDGYYSSSYLHDTYRQALKETYVADIGIDPISGRKTINQYEIIDELSRGLDGKVKLGRNLKTGIYVAIKVVDRHPKHRRVEKNTNQEDRIKNEIAILKKARHPNIVSLLEVIDDPTRNKVYMVLEYVELGEVRWRTKGEKEIALIEWRRYQHESQETFDNESANRGDESILVHTCERRQCKLRRMAKMTHMRRPNDTENGPWSLEHGHGGDSDDASEGDLFRASTCADETPASLCQENGSQHGVNMETVYQSTIPIAAYQQDLRIATGLEGTMYSGYSTELIRCITPSLAGASSSRITDDDYVPEHFCYVPLMTLQEAQETFRDTVLGLEYLHYQGVVHRDIKPANLLQTKDRRIKLSDFSVSYLGRQQSKDSTGDESESNIQDAAEAIELAKTIGTPAFYAPELCQTDLNDDAPPATNKIDIWSLGVTLYCLVFGRVPFHEHNTFRLMKLISETEVYIPKYRLKAVAEQSGSTTNSQRQMCQSITTGKRAPHNLEYEEVDGVLRDLLKRLLTKDPRQRISIKDIKHHPWLLQGLKTF